MRYKPGQKEETRRKMVEAASRSFRSYGYSGIGVDGLAKAAGVTSGAFYTHFGSKNAAFGVALEFGLDEVIDAVPKFQSENGTEWVNAFADYYMGKAHRDDLAGGCAMTALSPEVIRSDRGVHKTYEKKMTRITELIASGLAGESSVDRKARAWALLCTLIGGLTVARAVSGTAVADEIAAAVKIAAITAAGQALGQ